MSNYRSVNELNSSDFLGKFESIIVATAHCNYCTSNPLYYMLCTHQAKVKLFFHVCFFFCLFCFRSHFRLVQFFRSDSDRSIMLDVARDNRVVSMAAKVGLKNNLVTMLDQLQRCQKSLNEFLEVCKAASITLYVFATF